MNSVFRFVVVLSLLSAVSAAQPQSRRIEFLRDIAPILDRGGCSTAECHGKFGGRGGLQLSLLTLTPEDDYEPLVTLDKGRRINFARPDQSLILLKAAMVVPHKGGQRFKVGSPQYNTILTWIQQGAPFEKTDPRLEKLVMLPEKVTLPKAGVAVPLKVIATYTDGTKRDVTAQTVFSSTNDAVLKVSTAGVVTGARWGGGAIIGRYLGTVVPSFFTLPQTLKGKYPQVAEANVVDKPVFENLRRLNVIPSGLSSDEEFLRRVSLDTRGRLPTAEEIDAFLADKSADKRAKIIDTYLASPDYTDFRTLRLADLLRVNPRKFGAGNGSLSDRSAVLFYDWIWNSVRNNMPWDRFAKELITARGSTYQVGPANFFRIERTANDRMENIGQAFLGVRMSCARCHKHPFDKWNTDDYWNFAAFCGKVSARGGELYQETIIDYNPGARVVNQSVTGRNRGKVAPPTYLGDKDPAPESPDMIAAFADWMTSPKNPFFARATVNRLWSHYFGKGIINPVDDMRATVPESVPGLLDTLAGELIKSRYDIRHVTRLILNSRTYQLSSKPNATNVLDDRYFSRAYTRPMPAPALLDMINQATGANESFGAFQERTRAVQAAIPANNYFLTVFGQSHREFLADIDPKLEPNLVQTLHMINGPYIDQKIRGGAVTQEIAAKSKSDEEMIRSLYLRTLSRYPTGPEVSRAQELLRGVSNRKEAAQDMMWALLTSREFYFNH
jgi:hypothetical protein